MSSVLRKMSSSFGSSKGGGEEEVLLGIGDTAPDFELVDHEGTKHKLSDFRGKRVLLSFFRYASWPLCLYNVDRLKQQADFLTAADIVTLCIFRSDPPNVAKGMYNLCGQCFGEGGACAWWCVYVSERQTYMIIC